MNPDISVVLTTFNGASRGFLRAAIESVLAQTERQFELLLVDDGSVDNTAAVCAEYLRDERVRYLRKENGGAASARNAGIAEARGDLICFLDDDDFWFTEKLARQRSRFELEYPRPGLVYTAIQVVDTAGSPLFVQSHPAAGDFYRALFYENAVDATSTVMVTADSIREVGNFREDVFAGSLQGCEDRELWIRIARRFQVVSVDEPLVGYRLHGARLSMLHCNMEESELTMLSLALEGAPPEIRAQQPDIYRNLFARFAHNRFTLAEYAEFRRHFRSARSFGNVGVSLWIRFFLALIPGVINPLRRLLGKPGANTPRPHTPLGEPV